MKLLFTSFLALTLLKASTINAKPAERKKNKKNKKTKTRPIVLEVTDAQETAEVSAQPVATAQTAVRNNVDAFENK
jgi:hypothetical protein